MDVIVFIAVLIGAAFHASWNAILKGRLDPLVMVALIAMGSAVCAAPLLYFVGFPRLDALPWLGTSIVLHTFYMVSLTTAYRHGDMSQVYPLARGSAPLLTAIVTTTIVGDVLTPTAWGGVLLLSCGIVLLSLRGHNPVHGFNAAALKYAGLTAVIISGYSIVDGLGARAGADAHSYTLWLFFLDGIAVGLVAFARRGALLVSSFRSHWKQGLIGGALSLGSYWIAIWAMTRAPIAMVSALRETSVLFAAIISVVVLKERLNLARGTAIAVILAGLVLMRVAG